VAPQFGITDPVDLHNVGQLVRSLTFYEPEDTTILLQEQLPQIFPFLEKKQAAQIAEAVEKQLQSLTR
jgi:hypothetical protein